MIKGTQILTGKEASEYRRICSSLYFSAMTEGYSEVILPSLWEPSTFEEKIKGETLNQMWKFKDKGDRDVCLIPEATGIIQKMYSEEWSKSWKKPIRLFYLTRCFRYEKPQLGRLREFTQFGVELLTDEVTKEQEAEVKNLLTDCLDDLGNLKYTWKPTVKRGLGYYVSDGFEAECENLGSQKQIAGGGKYKEGIGWAIGVERVLLSILGGAGGTG